MNKSRKGRRNCWMRRTLIFIFLIFNFLIAQNGRIVYEGEGIFSFEELTVECWIRFKFDPEEKTEKIRIPKGNILQFESIDRKTSFSISCGLRTGKKGKEDSSAFIRIAFVIDGKKVPHPVYLDCKNWKNEWHHLAICWKEGKNIVVFVDGNEVINYSFLERMQKDIFGKSNIIIGTPTNWHYENLVEVDEIRISSIARDKGSLLIYAEESVDPYVLFYENFDNIEKEGNLIFTVPYISNIENKKRYEIIGGEIIDGKIGKGFSFIKKETR
ncbi:MAG: LamG domain-containing protein [Candidatus Omnitrophica bacterium]|nr:LamG domain-containing protein [Candidatus Omnitrophota bacterium]